MQHVYFFQYNICFSVVLIPVNSDHSAAGDNLFIGSCGELKIGDFGNAQYMEDGEVNSYLQGTVNYMAPEVSRSMCYNICYLIIIIIIITSFIKKLTKYNFVVVFLVSFFYTFYFFSCALDSAGSLQSFSAH